MSTTACGKLFRFPAWRLYLQLVGQQRAAWRRFLARGPMISAIVLVPDLWTGRDLGRERETVVRSMVWLVSAVVAGVIRDVTLAVPAGLGLSELAVQSGCGLVQADTERERLSAAVAAAREARLMVIKAGFQPDAGLVEELDLFVRRQPDDSVALLRKVGSTTMQRLIPPRMPVGCLVPRLMAVADGGFDKLARAAARRGTVLQSTARSIC